MMDLSRRDRIGGDRARDRQSGSGQQTARRPPGVGEGLRKYSADNRTVSCRVAAHALNPPRATDRRAIEEDIMCKPPRQVTAHRAKPVSMTKRLEACQKWNDQIQSGELDVAKIYFADEELFRIGACHSGNQNFVVYANRGG